MVTEIKSIPIEEITRKSLKEYSYYVTTSRVLPGLDLKPVHRRVLYSAMKIGARHEIGRFRKCLAIVGTCSLLHPHGDTSIMDGIATLQSTPNALIEGQGNWGGNFGEPIAGSRYIEARTSEVFESLIDDYMFKIGDFKPNYDDTSKEPVILQTKLPLSLLIGCYGIGIGLSTSLPSFHVSTVKEMILKGSEDIETKDYAYGGVLIENRIFPTITREGDYLRVKNLPIGTSGRITVDSPLLKELQSSRQIEIIDESHLEEFNIKIKAPLGIQKMIVKSMSRPIINNFYYFWNRLRNSGYATEWINNRADFITNRSYYDSVDKFEKSMRNKCVNELSKYSKVGDVVENVSKDVYKESVSKLDLSPMISKYLKSSDEFVSAMKSIPVSSIKPNSLDLELVKTHNLEDSLNILKEEVTNIDESIFSRKSITSKPIKYIETNPPITRYLAIRDYGVEVKMSSIPRVFCWSVTDIVTLVYSNHKLEKLSDSFFGQKESKDSSIQIVGFTVPDRVLVVITESMKIHFIKRLSAIKEPLINVFPAKVLSVDGKDYKVTTGTVIEKFKSWKVIE